MQKIPNRGIEDAAAAIAEAAVIEEAVVIAEAATPRPTTVCWSSVNEESKFSKPLGETFDPLPSSFTTMVIVDFLSHLKDLCPKQTPILAPSFLCDHHCIGKMEATELMCYHYLSPFQHPSMLLSPTTCHRLHIQMQDVSFFSSVKPLTRLLPSIKGVSRVVGEMFVAICPLISSSKASSRILTRLNSENVSSMFM
ncbi:unnamed protein product [Lactuca saligna]|uniref:Uncharacterized protein n=1 Tax=Lactuca saligna TaxID=75948 RepID=A0AA36E2C9_LACSI|nr:unnamed protein product [Lactuca saligna]